MAIELPENFTVDLDDLTMGEIEDIEDLTGHALAAISSQLTGEHPPMRMLRAVVFVMLRREYPELTFEETRDIKLRRLKQVAAPTEVEDADPTQPRDVPSIVAPAA